MSELLARKVLRYVAKHYRKNPGSLSPGSGTLTVASNQKDPDVIKRELVKPGACGCIYTMILCYAAIVGGTEREEVVEAAVTLLVGRGELRPNYSALWQKSVNDFKTSDDAVRFIYKKLRATPPRRVAGHGAGISSSAWNAIRSFS